MPWMGGRFFWNRRVFFESDNAPILVGFNHAKLLGGLRSWNVNGRNCDVRAGVAVLLQHPAVIHLVDMVARENENEFGTLAANGVDILVDRVGGALIPLLRNAHLRRQNLEVIPQPGQRRPAGADVPVQAESFVLREYEDAPQVRIDAVG